MGAQISNSAEVRQSAILGLGVYRPERVVSNAEICETIDSTDEWIQSRSGIKNRRFANADESVLAMAIASGRKALAASGIEPEQVVQKMRSGVQGVLVGRGVLRNPWILSQSTDIMAGRAPRVVTMEDRGQFLLDYIDLLMQERVDDARAMTHDRWVVNKLRALGSWYTKGLDNGSHLRTAINSADSLERLRATITSFFMAPAEVSS